MKWLFLVVIFILFAIVIDDRFTLEKINAELRLAQQQISQLNQANTFSSKRKAIKFVKRDQSRARVFGFLYEINKDKKRIKYLPGEFIVEDLELSQNDQFLDLLDLLYEQEQLIMIEIPENKTIKEDLRVAGFSSEYISKSKDGLFRIRFKEY